MSGKIMRIMAGMGVLVMCGAGLMAPVKADVLCDNITDSEMRARLGCDGGGGGGGTKNELANTMTNILKVVIGIAGLVAVVFVIVGGVGYMTSAGDPSKVKKAKDTILYAVVGLIVCALAFAIVNWTIGAISKKPAGGGSSTTTTP